MGCCPSKVKKKQTCVYCLKRLDQSEFSDSDKKKYMCCNKCRTAMIGRLF